jgi:hypothetical protein
MLGLGFGVRHIPATLPDVVFALFSGLNAAAVGLITLAAYTLSSKVITDPLTRIEVLVSAAFGSCYQSQWLYPVLMAAGGLATLVLDTWRVWREQRRLRLLQHREETDQSLEQVVDGTGTATSPNLHVEEDIEMHNISRPEPVAAPPSRVETHSMDKPKSNEENMSTLSHRRSTVAKDTSASEHPTEPEEAELWQYFSLSVRGGLCMSVTSSIISFGI